MAWARGGAFAAAGGFWFLWKSWLLHRAPGPATAIANFRASLVQLLLLVAGVVLQAALW